MGDALSRWGGSPYDDGSGRRLYARDGKTALLQRRIGFDFPGERGGAYYHVICAEHDADQGTARCPRCPAPEAGIRSTMTTLVFLPTGERGGSGSAKIAKDTLARGGDHTLSNQAEFAGDADRERAVAFLRNAWMGGYLTEGEYLELVARAYDARTQGDLAATRRRLPATLSPAGPQSPAKPVRQWQVWDYVTVVFTVALIAGVILGIAAL